MILWCTYFKDANFMWDVVCGCVPKCVFSALCVCVCMCVCACVCVVKSEGWEREREGEEFLDF